MKLFVKQDFKAVELKASPRFDGSYDVLVAGLGSGGFYAAWRAAKLGLRTLGVERMGRRPRAAAEEDRRHPPVTAGRDMVQFT